MKTFLKHLIAIILYGLACSVAKLAFTDWIIVYVLIIAGYSVQSHEF